jgi:hypothetical protein
LDYKKILPPFSNKNNNFSIKTESSSEKKNKDKKITNKILYFFLL